MKYLNCIILLIIILGSCSEKETKIRTGSIDYGQLDLPERPNILWIVAEDLSAYVPAYGDSTVTTPHIDRLVREGIKYTNVYSPSGVCAPSRAAIVTGMYPTRIGAHHMRTGPWFRFTIKDQAIENFPRKAYEAIPPEGTHMLSTYLRELGYYCSNNPKEDYQFRCEMTAWDESGFQAHWNKRLPGQPFFSIFNLDNTHESMIWRKAKDSLMVSHDLEVPVEPYLPDTEIAQNDIRRLYSNIVEMDIRVGEILEELESSNLLDSTIIIWYTDHGGPLPRQKRTVYHSGLHVPMVIRFPHQQLAGSVDSQMLSFIDLKPTMLSLLGIEPPDYVDGKAWMGQYKTDAPRKFLFAAADRFDNETDKMRAVFDNRYKLIRYYNLNQSYYLPVKYRETMPIMKELLRLRDEGNLTPEQALWFRETKDSIEFFDTWNDPDELNNLVHQQDMQEIIEAFKAELDQWITDTNDKGMITEDSLMNQLWPGGEQPVTEVPEITMKNGNIVVTCATPGASIGYQWSESIDSLSTSWSIYNGGLDTKQYMKLFVRAHRIGFRPSELTSLTFQ